MPSVVSWPTVLRAGFYVLALPFLPESRLPRGDAVLLGSGLFIGYAFYSMIAVKEPRLAPSLLSIECFPASAFAVPCRWDLPG